MISRRRFVFCALALSGCTQNPSRSAPPEREASRMAPNGMERQVFEAVNAERKKQRSPELQWHAGAAAAAQSHSRVMAERRFFSHTDPERGDLKTRLKNAHVGWTAIAENLFQQRGCRDPVRCAVDGWLQSAGHRRNMLNPSYTHTGIGISRDTRGTLYYTQVFLVPG